MVLHDGGKSTDSWKKLFFEGVFLHGGVLWKSWVKRNPTHGQYPESSLLTPCRTHGITFPTPNVSNNQKKNSSERLCISFLLYSLELPSLFLMFFLNRCVFFLSKCPHLIVQTF
ncbi:hypothetical protein ATANTOWER_008112 [Ataeniobius toweri]|uniref:Uncharacterized protein n=1 Tax=Ataeniobius toweri TaxID=208326 RepID=A0ABU7BRC5_9TELE|nr:hypothetical protein [Ataeniobius toweri]